MNKPNGSVNKSDLTDQLMMMIQNVSEERQRYLLDLLKQWDANKERQPRKPCNVPVDYATEKRAFCDFIHDISTSGVFIETRNPFSIGQNITLTFSLPESENPFKIIGEIVRTESKGIAVKFVNITQYREWIIKSLLEEMVGEFKI